MFRELLKLLTEWQQKKRQARAAWEWRIGYLSTLDRRLFPNEPPMMSELERTKLRARSRAFRLGADMANSRPEGLSRLSPTAENCMRLAVSNA